MEPWARASWLLVVVASSMTACSVSAGGGGGEEDAEATFNVEFLPPDGSGLASRDVDRKFGAVVTLNASLPAALIVTGRVIDRSGAPMRGLEVSFHRTSTSPSLDEAMTDTDGHYSVAVPAGTWVVRLKPENDALGTRTLRGITVTTPSTVDLQFPRPAAVPGVVYEDDGTSPIAGASVEFTGSTTGARASVTADERGEFEVPLTPDTYDIVVTPNGAAALTHLRQRFTVRVTGARALGFILTRGVRVSGMVHRYLGPPLPDTDVKVVPDEDSPFFAPPRVRTDSVDGTYSIDLVPPGTVTFELQPPADTGYPRQLVTRDIAGPTTQNENLWLEAGYVLSGRIFQADGVTPESGVRIRAVRFNGSPPPEDDDESDVTGGAGDYAVSVFPGFWSVLVIPERSRGLVPEIRSFPVMRDLILNVALDRGVRLSGTVTAPDGVTPLPDIRVEIPDIPETFSVTDHAGVYSLLAPVGLQMLELTAEGGPFEAVALNPVENVVVSSPGPVTRDITVSVATTGSRIVQGTVYRADGVTPLPGAVVRATDNRSGEIIGVTTSGADGDYVLVLAE